MSCVSGGYMTVCVWRLHDSTCVSVDHDCTCVCGGYMTLYVCLEAT